MFLEPVYITLVDRKDIPQKRYAFYLIFIAHIFGGDIRYICPVRAEKVCERYRDIDEKTPVNEYPVFKRIRRENERDRYGKRQDLGNGSLLKDRKGAGREIYGGNIYRYLQIPEVCIPERIGEHLLNFTAFEHGRSREKLRFGNDLLGEGKEIPLLDRRVEILDLGKDREIEEFEGLFGCFLQVSVIEAVKG